MHNRCLGTFDLNFLRQHFFFLGLFLAIALLLFLLLHYHANIGVSLRFETGFFEANPFDLIIDEPIV
jgi:hypothetical protein